MSSHLIPTNCPDHILVASPSFIVRQRILESLRSPLRHFEQTSGGAEALVHLERGPWQMLFLDRRLPDLDAEELSQTVRRRYPGVEVVLLEPEADPAHEAGFDKQRNAVTATDHDRPLSELPLTVTPEIEKQSCSAAIPRSGTAPLPGMIGNSAAMRPVYYFARLLSLRTTAVMITGPTGSGKEIVARGIHQLSPRAARSFVVVNCAAIPETLLEAELFGYSRGAFTGAMQAYAGRIHAAHGGTLFLDEIGEMPLSLQPKLLRFLEQKELQRLGSSEVVRVDTRLISATNAHLLSLVREGKFREDLYYRLCGFPIEIPPLQDRSEDIALLAAYFLEKYAAQIPAPTLSLDSLQLLKSHAWPGNIRELQNVMERALILAQEEPVIRPEHLLLSGQSIAARAKGHLQPCPA